MLNDDLLPVEGSTGGDDDKSFLPFTQNFIQNSKDCESIMIHAHFADFDASCQNNEIQRDMRKKFKQINLALRIQSKGDVRPSFIQTRDFPEMMTKIMICFRIIGKSSQFSNFYL